MIPPILHFVFGMAEDFGGVPFSLCHAVAIRSAIEVNRPEVALVHTAFEPTGPWWESIRGLVEVRHVEPPAEVFGRPLRHVAHKADLVRLEVLLEHGGVYLDLDTVSVRPLAPLMGHECVLGREETPGEAAFGLCNAVILASPGSSFIARWRESYATFDDRYWSTHSVVVPRLLAKECLPGELHVEPPESFFTPSWSDADLRRMFVEDHEFPRAYVHHLWASRSWEPYLAGLTEGDLREGTSTYARLASRFL